MEIISYVVKGALEHQDSMGNKTVILPGEVQRLSAGAGIVHSEKNQLANVETHFFQIWIMPNAKGHAPGYGQKSFAAELDKEKLVLVVSEDGREGSIDIRQDADIYLSRLKASDDFEFNVRNKRGVWIQVIRGEIEVLAGETKTGSQPSVLKAGDGFSVEGETLLKIKAHEASELMLFDLL